VNVNKLLACIAAGAHHNTSQLSAWLHASLLGACWLEIPLFLPSKLPDGLSYHP